MRKGRWLPFVAFLLLVAIGVGWWFWLRSRPSEPSAAAKPSEPPQLQPGITMEGVEGLILRREGRKTWELFVDIITLDKNQTQATARGIRKAIYYDEKGKPLLWFSAANPSGHAGLLARAGVPLKGQEKPLLTFPLDGSGGGLSVAIERVTALALSTALATLLSAAIALQCLGSAKGRTRSPLARPVEFGHTKPIAPRSAMGQAMPNLLPIAPNANVLALDSANAQPSPSI